MIHIAESRGLALHLISQRPGLLTILTRPSKASVETSLLSRRLRAAALARLVEAGLAAVRTLLL